MIIILSHSSIITFWIKSFSKVLGIDRHKEAGYLLSEGARLFLRRKLFSHINHIDLAFWCSGQQVFHHKVELLINGVDIIVIK